MSALATAPGVVATPGKYYIGAQEVMEYLDCKENKAYELIRQLRDELIKAGKLTPAYPIGKIQSRSEKRQVVQIRTAGVLRHIAGIWQTIQSA